MHLKQKRAWYGFQSGAQGETCPSAFLTNFSSLSLCTLVSRPYSLYVVDVASGLDVDILKIRSIEKLTLTVQAHMKSILLIDDDKFVTTLYAAKLQSEGFVVDTAHSGEDAIEKLEKNCPDMIVLDLNMPGISGVELLRAIRAVPLFQQVPVIIFSSGYIRSLVDEAKTLGINKILAKSQCPPKMLIAEVKAILGWEPAPVAVLPDDAAALAESPTTDDLPTLLELFVSSKESSVMHGLLLRIYKASLQHINRALAESDSTVQGQLGRALEKLIADLYAHPEHITESTKQTLVAGLQKLNRIYTEKPKTTLDSELALKDLLRSLEG